MPKNRSILYFFRLPSCIRWVFKFFTQLEWLKFITHMTWVISYESYNMIEISALSELKFNRQALLRWFYDLKDGYDDNQYQYSVISCTRSMMSHHCGKLTESCFTIPQTTAVFKILFGIESIFGPQRGVWIQVKTITCNYIGDSTVLIVPLMPTLSCTSLHTDWWTILRFTITGGIYHPATICQPWCH